MDDNRFDELARTLVAGLPRRRLIQALGGGTLAAFLTRLGVEEAAACQRKGQRCGNGRGGCCGDLKCCNKRCRNVKSDENFCGACTIACPDQPQHICSSGECCRLTPCAGPNECPQDPTATAVCRNGECGVTCSNPNFPQPCCSQCCVSDAVCCAGVCCAAGAGCDIVNQQCL